MSYTMRLATPSFADPPAASAPSRWQATLPQNSF
jgi:hypothetical protein